MYEIDMDIYRHFRAMEKIKIVDMRFPYYVEHIPEVEISDEEREDIHRILREMGVEEENVLEELRIPEIG